MNGTSSDIETFLQRSKSWLKLKRDISRSNKKDKQDNAQNEEQQQQQQQQPSKPSRAKKRR